MNIPKFSEAIPIIGACLGGFICGVIARNGFVDWTGETLVAGFLGLVGGAFAYSSAKMQINHQIQVSSDNKKTLAKRFMQELKAQTQMITFTTRAVINEDFQVNKGRVEFILGVFNSHNFPEIPAEIDDSIANAAIRLRQRVNLFITSVSRDHTGGLFTMSNVSFNENQQKIIKNLDSQARELIKAIEEQLNS
ncbi:hypothetical protein TH15_14850 [Thalassospira profundimaris]|uniref:Uncharacterized protein n=1 Tax=Thalassospira indica TaxID=1891279 RepID=A0ABN5NGP7_9PROT|nr:hypothetical protein DY252_11115 [Thalassospira indica]OAZ12696.1 hypothetical protein TH15_14850 [Thalassospira profundimaris]